MSKLLEEAKPATEAALSMGTIYLDVAIATAVSNVHGQLHARICRADVPPVSNTLWVGCLRPIQIMHDTIGHGQLPLIFLDSAFECHVTLIP